jgi:hypothetical protein
MGVRDQRHCSISYRGRPIDYRSDNGHFWMTACDYQISTQTSQNLDVEQQIWIFIVTKSRFTNVSIPDLMHQEHTNSSIAW